MDPQTTNPLTEAGGSPLTFHQAFGAPMDAPAEQPPPAPAAPPERARPQAPTEQPPAREEEPAAAEAQPDADAPEQETEDDDLPPLKAPAFWKKAARDIFDQLPRHAQQDLLEQEQERNTGVERALREAAEKRKSAESEQLAAQNERQRYQQALNTHVPMLQQQLQGKWKGFDEAKWAQLSVDDPARWAALKQEFENDVRGLQAARYEQQRLAHQQQEADQKATAETAKREWNALVEKRPELKDRTKAEAWFKDINAYALEAGYTQEQIQSNTLHTNLLILEKAMKYDAAQKAKAAAVVRPVPQVQQPGSAKAKGERRADARAAQLAKLDKSGDINDALDLLLP